MADKGNSEGHSKGKGSEGVHGKNVGGQLRALFAKGYLSSSKGKGGKRKVAYHKGADATSRRNLGRNAKRAGLSAGHNHNNNAAKSGYSGRVVLGGKIAGMRSGTGGKSVKSRAERIAAGRKIANTPEVARKALKGTGLRVRASNRSDAAQNPLIANGSRKTGMNAKGDTRFLVQTARKVGVKAERKGKSAPVKPDHSATRASRIAAGKAIAAKHPEVQLWKGQEKQLVIANRYRASQVPVMRQKAAAKKVAVQKASDSYVKALVRSQANVFDNKAQRARRRTYDKLISTVSDGFKSKRHAHKAEVDSVLRRAHHAARKQGVVLLK